MNEQMQARASKLDQNAHKWEYVRVWNLIEMNSGRLTYEGWKKYIGENTSSVIGENTSSVEEFNRVMGDMLETGNLVEINCGMTYDPQKRVMVNRIVYQPVSHRTWLDVPTLMTLAQMMRDEYYHSGVISIDAGTAVPTVHIRPEAMEAILPQEEWTCELRTNDEIKYKYWVQIGDVIFFTITNDEINCKNAHFVSTMDEMVFVFDSEVA